MGDAKEKTVRLNLKEMTILIVDPNEFSRSFTRGICRGFRFGGVEAAASAPEALEIMSKQPIDVVISDWVLPPLGGSIFIRQLRVSPLVATPEVPVIILTAATDHHTLLAARDAGINDFLTRPLALGRFLTCLENVLRSPLPFIRADRYIGPCRRRKSRPFAGAERRTSGQRNQVWSSYLSQLSEKVQKPGGMTTDEMLEAGNAVVKVEETRYREVRSHDLEMLFGLIKSMKETKDSPQEYLDQIFIKANDLRGMGQTFGYPLLTTTGGLLCDLIHDLPPESVKSLTVLQAIETHATVMKMIIDSDMKNDKDALAVELIEGLQTLVSKTAGMKKAGQK